MYKNVLGPTNVLSYLHSKQSLHRNVCQAGF